MNKHTPGPWEVRHEFNVMARRGRVAEAVVASCGGFSDNTDGGLHHAENVANARLVAAAPDLLAALRDAVACTEDDPGSSGCFNMDAARAAIAKATTP